MMDLERLIDKAGAEIHNGASPLVIMRALERLEKAQGAARTNHQLHSLLARGHFLLGSFEEAIEHGEQARLLGNTELDNYYSIGNSLEALHDFRQAKEVWRESLNHYPLNAYSHLSLGHAHAMVREYGKAKQHLGTALALDPKDLRTYFILGQIFLTEGDSLRVRELMDLAISQGIDDRQVYRQKALAHVLLKEYGQAQEAISKSVDNSNPDSMLAVIFADTLAGEGKAVEAKSAYNSVLEPLSQIKPKHRDRHFYHQAILVERGLESVGVARQYHFEEEGIVGGIISPREAKSIREKKCLPLEADMPLQNPFYSVPNPSLKKNRAV